MYKEIDETISIDQLLELYPPLQRSIRGNLVLSINGSVTSNGKSKELSSNVDRLIFHHLRAISSYIVVGAKTSILEPYGPVNKYLKYSELRSTLGLEPTPRLAVIASGSRSLTPLSRLGTNANKVLVFTPETNDISDIPKSLDVITVAPDRRFLQHIMEYLKERSEGTILCEGGPTLLSNLIDSNQVDELCLTVAPQLISKDNHTTFAGKVARSISLIAIASDHTHIYLRYRVRE